jgi:hypothetical protein
MHLLASGDTSSVSRPAMQTLQQIGNLKQLIFGMLHCKQSVSNAKELVFEAVAQ